MSFSSIASMLSAAQESGQPLYAVIRDADCQENGYDAAASYRQIAALWTAMQQSSRQYCASDRSNSGLIGGDAARFRAAAEAGRLLGGTYFQRVTEEALKVAECNACMKRIVAAPTAGSCGVLPAVLIPLAEERDVPEETILQALYIAAGFGQVTALRASVAGAEGGCQAEIGTASAMAAGLTSFWIEPCLLYRHGFGSTGLWGYFARYAAYAAATAGGCLLTGWIAARIPGAGIPAFLGKMAVCALVPNALFWLCFGRTAAFALIHTKVQKFLCGKRRARRQAP